MQNCKVPAPEPTPKDKIIPFVTTYNADTNNQFVMKNIGNKIENAYSEEIKEIFGDCKFILSQRQPKNPLRTITSSKIRDANDLQQRGLFKCKDKRCKIC